VLDHLPLTRDHLQRLGDVLAQLVKPMSSSVAAVEEWMNRCRVHQIFQISVLLKGAHAVIECIGGLTLALVSTNTIAALVNAITGFSWLPALTTI